MALVDAESRSPLIRAVQLVIIVAALMWLVEAVDLALLDGRLDQQGIVPRTWSGIDGVLWAPLLHGGFGHLAANTVPFVILGTFVAMEGPRRWVAVTATVVVMGGLATWLLARSAVHVGASGLVFGYAGFLLVAGFVEKSIKGIAVSLVVVLLFGGMVLRGITPVSSYVSWESHLFGLAAGVMAAFAIAAPESDRVNR
jgi:membrane associated rhomboid family serine protease